TGPAGRPHGATTPSASERAHQERARAAENATNASRVAAWRASANEVLLPWQTQVAAELESKAGSSNGLAGGTSGTALSASLAAGIGTLAGLSGHRLLLVLGGAEAGPSSLPPHSLAGLTLVVPNLSDPGAAAVWTTAAKDAGAESVTGP